MKTVELIFDPNCPNVQRAREQLVKAIAQSGIEAHWDEWDLSSTTNPDYVRRYGSPTILVNGEDVTGENPGEPNASCRVYEKPDGTLDGVPAVETIVKSLLSEATDSKKTETLEEIKVCT